MDPRRAPSDHVQFLPVHGGIALVLVLGHGAILALVDFAPAASGLVLVLLLLEILAVGFLMPARPPGARAAPATPPPVKGQMVQLREHCAQARQTLVSSLDESAGMGDLLGRGAKLLADFDKRLREEEESIKVLLTGGQVAKSAALNIQVVTSRLEAKGLDLMAHDLEALAMNLEEMANSRRKRLEEGHKVFRSMAQQLRTERERARGGARLATRLDDLMARMDDTVRLIEKSLDAGSDRGGSTPGAGS